MRDRQLVVALAIAPVVWLCAAGLSPDAAPAALSVERLIWLALVLSTSEEVIFRGALQSRLLATAWGPRSLGPVSRANLATSVAFAALHLIAHPPAHSAMVLLPSLVFGHFRERRGSLLVPIGLHAFYNAGYLLLV